MASTPFLNIDISPAANVLDSNSIKPRQAGHPHYEAATVADMRNVKGQHHTGPHGHSGCAETVDLLSESC